MRLITYEMGEEYITRMDEEYPGYRDEREKLYTFVKFLQELRVIYSLFYIGLCALCGLDVTEGLVNLLSTAVFYFWYTLLLQSGWGVAALMLAARAIGLGIGGAGLFEQRSVAGSGGARSGGGGCDIYHDRRNGHAVFRGSILHLCSV